MIDKMELLEALAEYFGIEAREDGLYDLGDYDWQSGCYMGNGSGQWLTLANVVEALERAGLVEW